MLKNIIFDLDGTLLPQNIDEFIEKYFYTLTKKISLGYDSDNLLKIKIGTDAM